jgi:alkylated DNA nucleotide flippase Atl1
MQITPEVLEQEFSLQTAATRLDFLSRRDSGATSRTPVPDRDEDDWTSLLDQETSLDVAESLELLALGEVIARKAHDSQLVGFRAALRNGASWEQVAAALDVTPAEAWTSYHRVIERQERAAVLDPQAAAEARDLAGDRPS